MNTLTTTMTSIALSLIGWVMLSSCAASPEDQAVEKIHTHAASWTKSYSDAELLKFMNRVCEGDMLESEAKEGNVTLNDEGYLIGIATSTICIRK